MQSVAILKVYIGNENAIIDELNFISYILDVSEGKKCLDFIENLILATP